MQLAVNILAAGSTVALVATGFGLIFGIARFFHFAHGILFTAGPYLVYLFARQLGLPLGLACVLAVALTTVLGCAMEVGCYRPLRRRGASPLVLLLASLGIYIVLQNVISLAFGDDTKTIRSGVVREGLLILGARITPIQVGIICTSAVLIAAVALFLRFTRLGKEIRAVANDPALAEAVGVRSDRTILWAFGIGSALAGVAGILVALDVDMTPTMGMNALMMAVVAVIIGGAGSIPGVALGALLLAAAQQFGAWQISSQWQDAIAFVILLAFLLFRPQGFLGRKLKSAAV